MPRQNRVNPFGALIAVPERGTLMGNRGCLHDAQGHIRRAFACRRWLICLLEFKGRHQTILAPGRYTQLFFLDEATALASGHRPCAECQRPRFRLFRATWAAANPDLAGSPEPSADVLDRVLHAERLDPAGGKRTYAERLSRLPPGVMVADADGRPYLVLAGALAPWHPGGYGPAVAKRGETEVRVLTPASVVRAIAAGYPVGVHPSAPGR